MSKPIRVTFNIPEEELLRLKADAIGEGVTVTHLLRKRNLIGAAIDQAREEGFEKVSVSNGKTKRELVIN